MVSPSGQSPAGPPPSPPLRAAAPVMLVRDGDDVAAPLEVLMVRRNLDSDFVGGAYVFPGGAVDPADSGTEAEACCHGRGDPEASEILGVGSGGLAYWVAALRECFEEAGLLLAYTRGGSLLSLADPEAAAQFLGYRAGVNDGTTGFLDVCRSEGLSLAVDRVHYFAHWTTPEGAPRRYDTRFFVAVAPPDQTAAHDAGEMVADEWVRPADALARYESGEIEMVVPTVRSLQDIGRFRTADELAAAAAAAVTVPTVEPHVMIEGRGVRISLPGDPGYQAATEARAPTL